MYWGGWPGGRHDRPKSLNFSVNKREKLREGVLFFFSWKGGGNFPQNE